MYKRTAILIFTLCFNFVESHGKENNVGEKQNLWSLRISQLYTEISVGTLPFNGNTYLSLGMAYGKPTRKNAWRKFIPQFVSSEDMSEGAKDVLQNMSTKDLYAGMISVGVCHEFFNRVSLYGQIGWGFVVDFSAATAEEKEVLDTDNSGKNIFVYNTAPVELGVGINVWKGFVVQGGVTYLWKEIPLLTLGVGYVF